VAGIGSEKRIPLLEVPREYREAEGGWFFRSVLLVKLPTRRAMTRSNLVVVLGAC